MRSVCRGRTRLRCSYPHHPWTWMILPMPRVQPSRNRRASPGDTYSGLYMNLKRTVARCPSRITMPPPLPSLSEECALSSAPCECSCSSPRPCPVSSSSSAAAPAEGEGAMTAGFVSLLAAAVVPPSTSASPCSAAGGQSIAVICAHCEIVCTCTTGSYFTLMAAGWCSSSTSAVNSNAARGAVRHEADGERSTIPLCLRSLIGDPLDPLAPPTPPLDLLFELETPRVPPLPTRARWALALALGSGLQEGSSAGSSAGAGATAKVALCPLTAVLAGLPFTWIDVTTTAWYRPCWSGPRSMRVPPFTVPA
mmetsp:Transcript_37959/g.65483  ORF Transcript_37959/g.65483 Transcript_37959/m.65483 type:complete len:309 (+) Transcript_37959:49-975(+)